MVLEYWSMYPFTKHFLNSLPADHLLLHVVGKTVAGWSRRDFDRACNDVAHGCVLHTCTRRARNHCECTLSHVGAMLRTRSHGIMRADPVRLLLVTSDAGVPLDRIELGLVVCTDQTESHTPRRELAGAPAAAYAKLATRLEVLPVLDLDRSKARDFDLARVVVRKGKLQCLRPPRWEDEHHYLEMELARRRGNLKRQCWTATEERRTSTEYQLHKSGTKTWRRHCRTVARDTAIQDVWATFPDFSVRCARDVRVG